jgi:predicted ATP-grasp superfamily ATP-dependent carboligase
VINRPAFTVPADRRIEDLEDASVTLRESIIAFRALVGAPFIRGRMVSVVFPGAGADVRVVHGLNQLTGYVKVRDNAGVTVYDGATGGPSGTSNLRATGAATVTLWVF